MNQSTQLTNENKPKKLKHYGTKLIVTGLTLLSYIIIGLVIGIHGDEISNAIPVHYVDFIAAVVTLPALCLVLIKLPSFFYYQAVFFCTIAQLFGMMLNFYDKFPWYDDFLHFVSGVLLTSFGYYIYKWLCKKAKSPEYTLLALSFSVFFSIACAAIWEIYEFSIDTFFGMTAQGKLVGDTMMDIVNGTGGAILGTLILFFYLRKKSTKTD